MMKRMLLAAALGFTAVPAGAVETSMQLVLELEGNAQRDVVAYQCDDMEEPFTVEYINAHPIFLAIVPIEGESLVFVNVISGSGARYVSGQYEWWDDGGEVTLTGTMAGEDAEPVTCRTMEEIP